MPGLFFKLERAVGGNVDIEFLIEHDVVLVELVVGPELARGQRRVNHRDHVILEHFAGAQAGHGDVLLTVVGVDGSFAFDGRAQILHGIVARLHHAAVGFDHADVGNLNALVGGVVAHLNLAPLLDSGLALHPDAGDGLFAARSIVFKAVDRTILLDDKGLLGIVVLGFFRLGGGGAGRLCGSRRRSGLLARLCWGGEGCSQGAGQKERQQETTHKVIVRPVPLLSQGGRSRKGQGCRL